MVNMLLQRTVLMVDFVILCKCHGNQAMNDSDRWLGDNLIIAIQTVEVNEFSIGTGVLCGQWE